MRNNSSLLEEIGKSVEKGHYKTTEELITKALKQHVPALEILEKGMVPAMRQMGEHYKNNEADIPRILAAARCMRKGLDLLAPNLESERGLYVGTVILGTVEGEKIWLPLCSVAPDLKLLILAWISQKNSLSKQFDKILTSLLSAFLLF